MTKYILGSFLLLSMSIFGQSSIAKSKRKTLVFIGGFGHTKMGLKRTFKDFQKRYSYKCPENRMGSAIEIVWPILFLLSKKASYINGHTLVIDGGFTAW